MLKRLVTIQEFVKVSSVLNPDNINLELDIDSALNNFNNLSKIDKQTIKLQQYLDQAGKQIDSFSNGQIYNMWDYINSIIEAGPNEHVNSIQIADYKQNIDTIKYVIIKWVETFIYTHQVFVDANVEAPSNLPFNIEGKSDNANIESTRLDLINILNTTFFFEKIYVSGSVEDSRFNPFTDFGQFSDLEIGNLENPNYKFSNGYIVRDVPYLGLENKGRLDLLEPRVTTLEQTEQGLIDKVNGLQDNLNATNRQVDKNTEDIKTIIGDGTGISLSGLDKRLTANETQTTKNKNDIVTINQKLEDITGGSGTSLKSLQEQINTNKANISNNSVLISNNTNSIGLIKTELTETTARSKQTRSDLGGFYNQYLQKIEDLQTEITKNDQRITSIETGFQWKGEWNESTNYSKNDQVTYNGITYTSEADNNQGFKPSDYPQYWKPTSSEFTNAIKKAIDDLDAKLNPKIEQNQKDILTNKESILDTQNDLNQAVDRIGILENKSNALDTLTKQHTQQINDIIGGSSGISLKTINDRLTTLDNNTAKLNANNVYSGFNDFNNNVSIYNDKAFQIGWNSGDIKFRLSPVAGKKDMLLETPQGYLEFKNRTVYDTLPEAQSETLTPNKNVQFVTKKYVDDQLTNYANLNNDNTFIGKTTIKKNWLVFDNVFEDDTNYGIIFTDHSKPHTYEGRLTASVGNTGQELLWNGSKVITEQDLEDDYALLAADNVFKGAKNIFRNSVVIGGLDQQFSAGTLEISGMNQYIGIDLKTKTLMREEHDASIRLNRDTGSLGINTDNNVVINAKKLDIGEASLSYSKYMNAWVYKDLTYDFTNNLLKIDGKALATQEWVNSKQPSGSYLDTQTTTAQTVKGLVNFNGGINVSGYRALTTNDASNYAKLTTSQYWSGVNQFGNTTNFNVTAFAKYDISSSDNDYTVANKKYIDNMMNTKFSRGQRLLKNVVTNKLIKIWGSAVTGVYRTNIQVPSDRTVVGVTLATLSDPRASEWWATTMVTANIDPSGYIQVQVWKYYDKNSDDSAWQNDIYINWITFP